MIIETGKFFDSIMLENGFIGEITKLNSIDLNKLVKLMEASFHYT